MVDMTAVDRAKSIGSSFAMEGLYFDDECRERVLKVLRGDMTGKEAIEELRQKYAMSGITNE